MICPAISSNASLYLVDVFSIFHTRSFCSTTRFPCSTSPCVCDDQGFLLMHLIPYLRRSIKRAPLNLVPLSHCTMDGGPSNINHCAMASATSSACLLLRAQSPLNLLKWFLACRIHLYCLSGSCFISMGSIYTGSNVSSTSIGCSGARVVEGLFM